MTEPLTEDEASVQQQILQTLTGYCETLDAALATTMPAMEWGVVFWTRGEQENPLAQVIFARPTAAGLVAAPDAMRTAARATQEATTGLTLHGLDTPERVCFYEQEFYVLSNFSAFQVEIWHMVFPTIENAYHWRKFLYDTAGDHLLEDRLSEVRSQIRQARSAHDVFQIAQLNRGLRQPDWDDVKVDVMRDLLRAKIAQHEYVFRKLMQTDGRTLVENSWRDDFWGWGENRDGQNMLGQLWMELRTELRQAALYEAGAEGAAHPTPWALWVLTEHA